MCSRSARRFKGQEDFENQIRACFHELQRIAFASRNILVDIKIPEALGPRQPNLRRAASPTSVTGFSDAEVNSYNSDAAGGPTHTPAGVTRSSTRSTGRNNRQSASTASTRNWRVNPSDLFDFDIDDTGTHALTLLKNFHL